MRAGPPDHVIRNGVGYEVIVDSYLAGELLAEGIPVGGGTYSADSGSEVIEKAKLAVPSLTHERSWVPGTDSRHPLARYGQELQFTAVTWLGDQTWRTPLGRLLVGDWTEDGGDVDVTLAGLLQRVKGDRLPRPTVPRKDGTLVSELRRLMLAGIPVSVAAGLVDRACPSSFQWEEDRLGGIYDIVDAWPARLLPDGLGGFRLVEDVSESTWSPVFTFNDGDEGTALRIPRTDTRDRAYNHVIARAQSDGEDAPLVQGEAFVSEGKYAVDGPYGRVTAFYSSPVLKTEGQCMSASASLLQKYLMPTNTVKVRAAVDPRIELLDPVEAISGGVTYRGWVLDYTLPLTPGDMDVTVGVL